MAKAESKILHEHFLNINIRNLKDINICMCIYTTL